jgi:hypothetical protein
MARFDDRHPGTTWSLSGESVTAVSPDGSAASFAVPFPPLDELSTVGLAAHLARPRQIGVVAVRKGGYGVARVVGAEIVAVKIGRRHVQGRSKAGGWSQQRFARRRENQAREAYEAAARHVQAILLPHVGDLDLLVTAGDRSAVDAVFDRRELQRLLALPQRWLPGVPDPSRQVVDEMVTAVRTVTIEVSDTNR